jgi:nitrogen-specific signal transduction histidine kinase
VPRRRLRSVAPAVAIRISASVSKVSPVLCRHSTVPTPRRCWSRRADIALAEAPIPDERISSGYAELPFEWLFAAASESVVVVDAASGLIVAANPAAALHLQSTRAALIGTPLLKAVDAARVGALDLSLECASRAGRAAPIIVRARDGGMELSATVSLFRNPPESYWLVRLTANSHTDADSDADTDGGRDEVHESPTSPVLAAIEGATVGFLIADSDLRIEYANRAFIDMIEVGCLEDLRSQSLQRWLQFTTSDSARLNAQMCQRQAVTVLDTTLHSESGSTRHVEVHAVAVPDEQSACWGFSISARGPVN